MRAYDDALAICTVGKSVTTGAASANTALPTDANGSPPKYVRVNATGPCWIKFGPSGVAATTNDIFISGSWPEIYATKGQANIAYLQQTGAQTLNITPLEG